MIEEVIFMLKITVEFDFTNIWHKVFPVLITGLIAFDMYHDGYTSNLLEIIQKIYSVLQSLNL